MKKFSIKRILRMICLRAVTHLPLELHVRARVAKWGGVDIKEPHTVTVGEGVIFDSMYPEEIEIDRHAHITMRVMILTHSLDTSRPKGVYWKKGHVHLCEHCFIGANTVICNSVTIGRNSIVGAGSVVTKDIPENEIWAGNPARFIKKRDLD